MKNKKKIIMITLVSILFISIIIAVAKKESIKKRIAKNNGYFDQSTKINKNRVLKFGSRGREVVLLQENLLRKGLDLGKTGDLKNGVDGWFGKLTKAALIKAYDVEEITLNQLEVIASKEQVPLPSETINDTQMA